MARRWVALILCAVALGACATPTTRRFALDPAAVERERAYQTALLESGEMQVDRPVARVNVGQFQEMRERIMAAASPWCGTGVRPLHRLRIADDGRLTGVDPGSPAAAAGLRPGDRLLSLTADSRQPSGSSGMQLRRTMEAAALRGQAIPVVYERDGEILSAALSPESMCAMPVSIENDRAPNAYSDGEQIVLTSGIVALAQTESELASVIAHEAAHNLMGHVEATQQNMIAAGAAGFLLDLLAASQGIDTQAGFTQLGAELGQLAYSQDFEREADYVGLYLLARAGYPLGKVPTFWRRMGVADPDSISIAYTHPSTAERFVYMESMIAEIEAKRAAGEALVPTPEGAAAR